jgi:sugar (pentulose or hexulose) kinase
VFRIEDAESELIGSSLDWTPRQFIDAAMERVAANIDAAMTRLTAADAVPGPEVEWTSEDGRSNSSDLYLRIVADVADCIRSIRVGDDPISEARTIVSRIAHEWKLAPVPISAPPVTKGEGE